MVPRTEDKGCLPGSSTRASSYESFPTMKASPVEATTSSPTSARLRGIAKKERQHAEEMWRLPLVTSQTYA